MAGVPLDEAPRVFGLPAAIDKAEVLDETKNAGLRVLKLKGYTSSGISQSVARLVGPRAQRAVHPARVHGAGGRIRLTRVAMSVPCIIGKNGRERIIEVGLAPAEHAQLEACCASLQDMLRQVGLAGLEQ